MTPERTSRTAYCPRCGRPDAPTEWRYGVEVLAHHVIPDGGGDCYRGSGRPVREEDR